MTLKRKIWDFYISSIRDFFIQKRPSKLDLKTDKKTSLCLVTIAFNKELLIKEQIRLVKKNVTDTNYIHIIADNSSDKKKRKEIEAICNKSNVSYVSLPFNWFSHIHELPSYSHGLAMSWVYQNLIKKIQPDFWGLLDHDIFPTKPYSCLQKIDDQDFYGRLIDRTPDGYPKKLWYLWAGFCFFNFDRIKQVKMNFMPCQVDGVYLDSAGGNYPPLYSKYNMENLRFATPVTEAYFKETNLLHLIDNDWVHTINGSNWKKAKDKDGFLGEFLKQF